MCTMWMLFFVHVHSPAIAKIIAVLLRSRIIIEQTLGSPFIVTKSFKKRKKQKKTESVLLQTVS